MLDIRGGSKNGNLNEIVSINNVCWKKTKNEHTNTVEPLYYRHHWAKEMCPH